MNNTGVKAAGTRGRAAGFFGFLGVLAAAMFAVTAAKAADINVVMSVEVDAPVGEVWSTVRAFDKFQDWHPAVESSTMRGSPEQVGTVRVLHLEGGGDIEERLTYLDDQGRTLIYEILESPLPVTNYKSYLSATATGGSRTVVIWGSTFDPKPGVSRAKAKETIEGIYQAGFDTLKTKFGR